MPSKQVFRLLHQTATFYASFPKAGTLDIRIWHKIGESFYVAKIQNKKIHMQTVTKYNLVKVALSSLQHKLAKKAKH